MISIVKLLETPLHPNDRPIFKQMVKDTYSKYKDNPTMYRNEIQRKAMMLKITRDRITPQVSKPTEKYFEMR